MPGDLTADVLARNAGLSAQQRDQDLVDVLLTDPRAAVRQQHVDELARLAILEPRLWRPDRFPPLDRVADGAVDRFGERGAGLVRRHVQQTYALVTVLAVVLVLPADRADGQPEDLIDTQPGEQPEQRDRADELERIPRLPVPAAGARAAGDPLW